METKRIIISIVRDKRHQGESIWSQLILINLINLILSINFRFLSPILITSFGASNYLLVCDDYIYKYINIIAKLE